MKLTKDPALRIQFIKIILLMVLLALPIVFHDAIAKKDSAEHASQDAEKVAKKEKKNKKDKKDKKAPESEKQNELTDETGRKLIHVKFEVSPSLRPAVDFWKMVYTKYDRKFEIFHDTENLKIIYSVLDFSDLYTNPSLTEEDIRTIRHERCEAEKDRIRAILTTLASGSYQVKDLSKEERYIYDLFNDDPNPAKFSEAAESRIRSQTGIKDKFEAGIAVSGAYLQKIEDIFNSSGIPVELTRIIFIESMFNLRARSKVGASGVWQFMPSTGRLYLSVNSIIDERNDPIRASYAAAQLLQSNFDALGTWPLAINAYNSGRGTMQSAVRNLGTTSIEDIIQNYRGGVYGFASRNFYPSFLAALEVANHYTKYFGDIQKDPPLQYEEHSLGSAVFLGTLAASAGISSADLANLNPHFSEEILSDMRKIPAGYSVRIPKGTNQKFEQAEALSTSQSSVR